MIRLVPRTATVDPDSLRVVVSVDQVGSKDSDLLDEFKDTKVDYVSVDQVGSKDSDLIFKVRSKSRGSKEIL